MSLKSGGSILNVNRRLDRTFEQVPVLPLNAASRYVLFSDCHRGNGSYGDNFLKNQHLYFAALQYYYDRDYTYLELGDGDELWENRSMKQIVEVHSNIFWLLSRYYREKRLYLLYGNHDIVKRYRRTASSCFSTWFCTEHQNQQPLFPGIIFYSGIILRDETMNTDLCLTHGHQADFLNSALWPLSRFLVRYLWRPLELLGIPDPTSAAKNNERKHRTEELLIQWAREKHHILITGHTHRPMIGSADSPYFNTGSCVHPRCVTCIELCNRRLTLVKWCMMARPDQSLYVGREVLGKSVNIEEL